MQRLDEYKRRYWQAMNVPPNKRDFYLAEIMTDMEREYRISMFAEVAEREVDEEVLRLYRLISDSRSM